MTQDSRSEAAKRLQERMARRQSFIDEKKLIPKRKYLFRESEGIHELRIDHEVSKKSVEDLDKRVNENRKLILWIVTGGLAAFYGLAVYAYTGMDKHIEKLDERIRVNENAVTKILSTEALEKAVTRAVKGALPVKGAAGE